MKHITFIAAVLATLSAGVQADETVSSADGKMSFTVHSAGINYGMNSRNNLQMDAIVTSKINGKLDRMQVAVTGCDSDGGKVRLLDTDTGKAYGESYVWILNGPSTMDDLAYAVCTVGADHYTAAKAAAPLKPVQKSKSKSGI